VCDEGRYLHAGERICSFELFQENNPFPIIKYCAVPTAGILHKYRYVTTYSIDLLNFRL
jgi:hypothetical protein